MFSLLKKVSIGLIHIALVLKCAHADDSNATQLLNQYAEQYKKYEQSLPKVETTIGNNTVSINQVAAQKDELIGKMQKGSQDIVDINGRISKTNSELSAVENSNDPADKQKAAKLRSELFVLKEKASSIRKANEGYKIQIEAKDKQISDLQNNSSSASKTYTSKEKEYMKYLKSKAEELVRLPNAQDLIGQVLLQDAATLKSNYGLSDYQIEQLKISARQVLRENSQAAQKKLSDLASDAPADIKEKYGQHLTLQAEILQLSQEEEELTNKISKLNEEYEAEFKRGGKGLIYDSSEMNRIEDELDKAKADYKKFLAQYYENGEKLKKLETGLQNHVHFINVAYAQSEAELEQTQDALRSNQSELDRAIEKKDGEKFYSSTIKNRVLHANRDHLLRKIDHLRNVHNFVDIALMDLEVLKTKHNIAEDELNDFLSLLDSEIQKLPIGKYVDKQVGKIAANMCSLVTLCEQSHKQIGEDGQHLVQSSGTLKDAIGQLLRSPEGTKLVTPAQDRSIKKDFELR